jgi:hypothetical protein
VNQKQNDIANICFSKGVLDNSRGPFFARRNWGTSTFESIARIGLFSMTVAVSAILLNIAQLALTPDVQAWPVIQLNQVTERLNRGYFSAASIATTTQLSLAEPSRVLGVATYRAPATTYQAELVSQNVTKLNIQSGRAYTLEAKFKNTGTATWARTGQNFLAMNVAEPAGRISPFKDASWKEYAYRPTRLKETKVKPGEIATFRFVIKAPSTGGQYTEKFALVAENKTWLAGGQVIFAITVTPQPKPYQAKLIVQSHTSLSVAPGQVFTLMADFKNTGLKAWSNTGQNFIALNVANPAGRASAFKHASWSEYPYRPSRLQNSVLPVGQIGRVILTMQAPLQPGVYTESFALVAENLAWVRDGTVTFTITVTQPDHTVLTNEPDIRVGLYRPAGSVQLTMAEPFNVTDGNGQLLLPAAASEPITVSYLAGTYTVQSATVTQTTTQPVSVTAADGDGVIELLNYDNRPSWNLSLNDNKFRHQIDIQYAAATQKLWVINQLPIESYLRGIAEAGNDNPDEFLKTMSIAERTYAMYHVQRQTKHADEHYTVDAANDQVYRGYGFEIRAPHVAQMVEATAGQIVTYNGELAITPYYSHSDGRTRSWEEVWSGGPYPWLVSVPDPDCQGMELLGHGVGMSALGALSRARAGATAAQILAYYYTGTSTAKLY